MHYLYITLPHVIFPSPVTLSLQRPPFGNRYILLTSLTRRSQELLLRTLMLLNFSFRVCIKLLQSKLTQLNTYNVKLDCLLYSSLLCHPSNAP